MVITRSFAFNSRLSNTGSFKTSKIYLKNFILFYFIFLASSQRLPSVSNKVVFCAKRSPLLTLVKSPMAHKKFAKEQFTFYSRSLFLSSRFKLRSSLNWRINDNFLNLILYINFLTRLVSNVSTNLLSLKSTSLHLPFMFKVY